MYPSVMYAWRERMWSVKSGCGARAADCIRSNAGQSCIIDWRSEDQMATRSSDEARCRRVLVGSPEHQRSEAPNINGRKPRTSTVGSPEHQRSEAPNINGRKPRTSTVGSDLQQTRHAGSCTGRHYLLPTRPSSRLACLGASVVSFSCVHSNLAPR